MNVCYNHEELRNFLGLAAEVSEKHPVVMSEFMQRCKEIEFDAVADNGEVIAYAISRGFKGVLSDSWGFTSPISGLTRITYVFEQICFLSSHHTSDAL